MSPPTLRSLLGAQASTVSASDSNTALLIIDAQNEYIDGKLATVDVEKTSAAIETLLNKFRQAHGNVVHIVHQVPEGAPVFTPGTRLAQEFDGLTPKDGEKVVGKQVPGAFTGTTLNDELNELGVKKIVLCGYMAHVCVSTTAREGSQAGYEVVVVEDAVGDRDIPGSNARDLVKTVMSELGDAFATIIQSGEVN